MQCLEGLAVKAPHQTIRVLRNGDTLRLSHKGGARKKRGLLCSLKEHKNPQPLRAHNLPLKKIAATLLKSDNYSTIA